MSTPQGHRGNGPPPSAEPSEFWVRLSELPRPVSDEYAFRARGDVVKPIVFWVLTAQELSSVRIEARRAAKAVFGEDAQSGDLAYEEEYENQRACSLLSLACRQPGDTRFPVFPSAREARVQLTDDEIAVALIAYAQFRRESGPIISELTPEEMEAWIELLREGGSRFPLARCSGEALIDLTMYLVSKLSTSPTAPSSAGSPPAAPSSPTTTSGGDAPVADAPAT